MYFFIVVFYTTLLSSLHWHNSSLSKNIVSSFNDKPIVDIKVVNGTLQVQIKQQSLI